ncbi:MAG: CerR family C-terminal domain-containing protein [Bauldia sp.]|nr:CerR family C-terminal domain-containing protein [Bauldia sp.]
MDTKTTPSPGRAYRRAKQDRGADTRARLVEAALDVFGHQGFEGATTREIAKAAEVNLAAIVYHFGSKEALYGAVAEHIVGQISARIGQPYAAVMQRVDTLGPDEARAAIRLLISNFVDMFMASGDEAARWARFVIREQLDPTPAFDIIYAFMGRMHEVATKLVAIASGGDPESPEMKVKAFTLLGQGMIFRVAQELVLRRLGRPALGEEERALIKQTIFGHIDLIFDGGTHARG